MQKKTFVLCYNRNKKKRGSGHSHKNRENKMRKFLGVSLVAVLAVSPMMAQADVATVATNDTTVGVASTKYVKEAYNAMAAAVNSELSGKADSADLTGKANVGLDNLSSAGTTVITNNVKSNAAVGTYNSSTNYASGTIGAAIKSANTTAGNAADKNLSNLSATGKANVSAVGTYDSTATYTAGTVGAAIKGKQDTISDLATIRSGAAAGATAVQSVAQGSTNGTIAVDGTDVAVKGLGSAAYTASTAYATSAQGTKADNAADKDLSNLSATGKANVSAVGTYDSTATYTAGTVGAAIKGKQDTISDLATIRSQAGAAANKDLGNLSTTGTGVITTNVTTNAAKGTFSASTTYDTGTIGAAIKGKQDTISDLATIRSGAAKGATSVQSVAQGSANGTIAVDGTDVAVKGLGTAAYTASTAYATSAQGTKADNAATAIGTGTLNTTATTLIAAVNEVNGKKLTVYSGWNAGAEPTVDTNKISLN